MKVYYKTKLGVLYQGDCLEVMKQSPDESVDCVVTSPPYWALRDYGVEGQLGLEATFNKYLEKLWQIFDEVYRVLKPTGTCWVNLGDTYNGNKTGNTDLKNNNVNTNTFKKTKNNKVKDKSLCMIPERFAIGMIERGWILRNQIIWHKPNCMPESVKDRFTVDFEKIFFFVKNKKYYFIQQFEPLVSKPHIPGNKKNYGRISDVKRIWGDPNKGKNKRTVWSINTKPFKDAHFAVFPSDIPQICIKAGCPNGGIVLDIFAGSGTTCVVAEKLNRRWIGIEINPDYCEIAKKRIQQQKPKLPIGV